MKNSRKNYDAQFKAKVALEAVKESRTLAEIASMYKVHPNQIVRWKKQVLEELPGIFSRKKDQIVTEFEERESQLYRQIGQLSVELDWLKKNLSLSIKEKRERVDFEHEQSLRLRMSAKNR